MATSKARKNVFRLDAMRAVTELGTPIAADGTDQSSNIITALSTLSTSERAVVFIPPGVRWYPQTVMDNATIKTLVNLTIVDLSLYSSFSAAGEAAKEIGIISPDTDVNDTHWRVGSGHHAIVQLNNFGTAGTTSAGQRKASFDWSCGYYELGSTDKRGARKAAILQFTKESSGSFWICTLRSRAPWAAINGEYELWAQGEVISATGVYRINGSNHYVSASTGTTGVTAPTHSSGTVSDGGVDWTWVDGSDRSVFAVDEYGRWLIGSGSFSNGTFQHKVSVTDPDGNYKFEGKARGTSKYAQLKLTPTDSGAAEDTAIPFLRAESGVGLRVQRSSGSGDIARFDDDKGTAVKEFAMLSATAADADATPSVDGVGTLYLTNSGATSITALDDGDDDQVVLLVATNGNTTLVHSATLFLHNGAANITLAAWDSVWMKKVPTSISNRWIQIDRG